MTGGDFHVLRSWFDSWPGSFADTEEVARFFGKDKPSSPAWVEGLATTPNGLVPRFDPPAMLATMRAQAGTSRAHEWSQLSVLTTLIRAADGVIADDEVEEMISTRPGLQVVEIDDSAHHVHLDQPDLVAGPLNGVVGELRARGTG